MSIVYLQIEVKPTLRACRLSELLYWLEALHRVRKCPYVAVSVVGGRSHITHRNHQSGKEIVCV